MRTPIAYGYAPEMQSGKGGFWASFEESNVYDQPLVLAQHPSPHTGVVLDRLEILWRKLEVEGFYVHANIVALAMDEIKRLSEMIVVDISE